MREWTLRMVGLLNKLNKTKIIHATFFAEERFEFKETIKLKRGMFLSNKP
jgi:hypothetical protein